MEAAIEVQNLNKSFGEEHVLKDVTHSFEKGKIHGIVGNNGSGKTVLMKCIRSYLFYQCQRLLRLEVVGMESSNLSTILHVEAGVTL